MYQEEFKTAVNFAKQKIRFLISNPFGYVIASLLAGMFISFGCFVTFTMGAYLTDAGYAPVKVIMAFSFASALSLVMMAGAELFTGNNFVMAVGTLAGQVSMKDTWKLWGINFLGNWLGSVLGTFLFFLTKMPTGIVGNFFAEIAYTKITGSPGTLFVKGILCNMLVCLAVWCGIRMKSEAGKLIMIFWCIYIFMICGFEHSIANMTVILVGLLNPSGLDITFWDYLYNLFFVTAGNMTGGILFVAVPYFLISKPILKNEK
ncbi:formate/nitrite transporter family protein [Velocimicrobium porci]|uniref:Formate/nitrite transporter family protein n=1 Tax=Velocimicrobium porci TaxID=2606634 RepID=A0A6L5XZD8_9FIRM|nr:formate/nitrite transporter family protein [Velocimicrobium porci]MSS64236.1 formate/nitrite transporter family protein [Velocimicrobium porci]